MKTNKACKFRIYPTASQQVMLAKTFGCVRFVYNRMLADKIKHYNETGKNLTVTPARYKKEFPWLKEIDSMALCNVQMNLQQAYANFFRDKSIGFPKFKSKHHSQKSYTSNVVNNNIRLEGKYIRLPKIGLVRVKLHRQISTDHVMKSVTVSQTSSGKYFISILTEYESDPINHALDLDKALGLDYSSPHFYVDDNNASADMPHFFRETQRKLAKEQRKLSHMVKGSHNYKRQKLVVARVHEKIRNSRNDWLHKESTRLADIYDVISVEDINYQSMAKSLNLGKSTNDNAFGQFRRLLQYKLAARGKKLITINKWFPSSKQCRFCGNKNLDLTLKDREWDCPVCGRHLLRDHNAAINIRKEGIRILLTMDGISVLQTA